MTFRRTLPRTGLAALVVCAMAVAGGALAWACTPKAIISLNGADAGPPGTTFTVNGVEFGSNSPINIYFDGIPVGQATASAQGDFVATARVPSSATPGTHTVQATNPEGVASAPFVVTGPDPDPDPDPDPGPGNAPGNGAPGAPARPAAPGSKGTTSAPGSSSGRASGGDVTSGRSSGSVSGGQGARAGERIGAGPGLATTRSGESVFADSVAPGQAGRRTAASAAEGSPSARSASGDLWSGFAAGEDGARSGLDQAAGPANGPGSALALSLGLAGLGLMALMAGVGATALRRRRAIARHHTTD